MDTEESRAIEEMLLDYKESRHEMYNLMSMISKASTGFEEKSTLVLAPQTDLMTFA